MLPSLRLRASAEEEVRFGRLQRPQNSNNQPMSTCSTEGLPEKDSQEGTATQGALKRVDGGSGRVRAVTTDVIVAVYGSEHCPAHRPDGTGADEFACCRGAGVGKRRQGGVALFVETLPCSCSGRSRSTFPVFRGMLSLDNQGDHALLLRQRLINQQQWPHTSTLRF